MYQLYIMLLMSVLKIMPVIIKHSYRHQRYLYQRSCYTDKLTLQRKDLFPTCSYVLSDLWARACNVFRSWLSMLFFFHLMLASNWSSFLYLILWTSAQYLYFFCLIYTRFLTSIISLPSLLQLNNLTVTN